MSLANADFSEAPYIIVRGDFSGSACAEAGRRLPTHRSKTGSKGDKQRQKAVFRKIFAIKFGHVK